MTLKRLSMLAGVVTAAGLPAMALDITTSAPGFVDSGAFAPGATQEDNTVQSGATNDQTWDYEAFTASTGGLLGVVAGFDMKSGQASGSPDFAGQGDIFIKVNGALAGHGLTSLGYDYVIHFTTLATVNGNVYTAGSTTGTGIGNVGYAIYAASAATVEYTGNSHINGGGALFADVALYGKDFTAAPLKTGTADYTDNVSDAASGGYLGGNHDLISNIDLTGLGLGSAATISFFTTMGCGNDVLYGSVGGPTLFSTPDGGTTVAMLGLGLTGLALARRRMA